MRGVLLAILLFGAPAIALAAGHGNLDEGRPLHFEDPYPVPRGEWSLEAGGGFRDARAGQDHAYFPIEALYGVAMNAQISVGTEFFSHPHALVTHGSASRSAQNPRNAPRRRVGRSRIAKAGA